MFPFRLLGTRPARLRGRLLLRPRSGERVARRAARRAHRRRRRRGGGFRRRVRARFGGGGGAPDAARRDADRPRVEGRARGSARGRPCGRHVRGRRRAGYRRGGAGGSGARRGGVRAARGGRVRFGTVSVSVSVSVSHVPTATPNQPAASASARVGGVGPNGVARSEPGIPSQELAALMCATRLRAESTVGFERGTVFVFFFARAAYQLVSRTPRAPS